MEFQQLCGEVIYVYIMHRFSSHFSIIYRAGCSMTLTLDAWMLGQTDTSYSLNSSGIQGNW